MLPGKTLPRPGFSIQNNTGSSPVSDLDWFKIVKLEMVPWKDKNVACPNYLTIFNRNVELFFQSPM
jgi:hypothetical protein